MSNISRIPPGTNVLTGQQKIDDKTLNKMIDYAMLHTERTGNDALTFLDGPPAGVDKMTPLTASGQAAQWAKDQGVPAPRAYVMGNRIVLASDEQLGPGSQVTHWMSFDPNVVGQKMMEPVAAPGPGKESLGDQIKDVGNSLGMGLAAGAGIATALGGSVVKNFIDSFEDSKKGGGFGAGGLGA